VRGTEDFDAYDLTEVLVGFDDAGPTQLQKEVFESFNTGKPLPLTWSEAIDVWVKTRSRTNTRPLAPGTIHQAKAAIKYLQPFGQPHQISKQNVRDFIEEREELVKPTTVKGYLKLYSAITDSLVELDHLESNVFKSVKYNVNEKRGNAFTDDQIRLLRKEHPAAFALIQTGMRPGELTWGEQEGNMMVIKPVIKDGKEVWRPKAVSSERRAPLPEGFKKPKFAYITWKRRFRELITDHEYRLHSGRHTFIELSRRADARDDVIREATGHFSSKGSDSHAGYGTFTDEVLRREAQKVWDLIDQITS